MQIRKLILISLALLLLPTTACLVQPPATREDTIITKPVTMKGVDINIPREDFFMMKSAGIDILTTEWGMEVSISRAESFLDKADAAGLKVILDGGFSYSAWGFSAADWDNLPEGKKPIWNRGKVQKWVKALKDHPAVFGWDICNEAGENLPSGPHAKNSQWPSTAITSKQLKWARIDVLQIDQDKPILIRMYAWDSSENTFGTYKSMDAGLADIVMLNIYSNYMQNDQLQWPEIIQDIGANNVETIKTADPDAQIWVALAAFEDSNIFQRPAPASLTRDIEETLEIPHVDGIAFFAWGPLYPQDTGSTWYLPQTGADLWEVIQHSIR